MADNILDRFDMEGLSEKIFHSDKKLKVGIIGTGWIAEAHIKEYKRMEDVEVVALADLIPGKAEAFKERYDVKGARCYLSDMEMLENEKLDAVSVCTYNAQHSPFTIHAL